MEKVILSRSYHEGQVEVLQLEKRLKGISCINVKPEGAHLSGNYKQFIMTEHQKQQRWGMMRENLLKATIRKIIKGILLATLPSSSAWLQQYIMFMWCDPAFQTTIECSGMRVYSFSSFPRNLEKDIERETPGNLDYYGDYVLWCQNIYSGLKSWLWCILFSNLFDLKSLSWHICKLKIIHTSGDNSHD